MKTIIRHITSTAPAINKYIEILETIGIDNSSYDNKQIFVWKDHKNIPTRQRSYKYSQARENRITSILAHYSQAQSHMSICYYIHNYYTLKG